MMQPFQHFHFTAKEEITSELKAESGNNPLRRGPERLSLTAREEALNYSSVQERQRSKNSEKHIHYFQLDGQCGGGVVKARSCWQHTERPHVRCMQGGINHLVCCLWTDDGVDQNWLPLIESPHFELISTKEISVNSQISRTNSKGAHVQMLRGVR